MRRLSTLSGLLWVALATAQEQPLLLDGFEGMLTERWGKVATETELVKEGAQALRWDTVQTAHLGRTVTAASWGEYGGLGLWVHSARATGAPILMTLHPPDNPASEGGDYYHWRWVVDWEGWRRLEAPWSLFARAREPLAWELIERLELHAAGWGQDKPVPGTVLVLDQLELTSLAPEELARRLADRAAVEKGSLTPLGDGQMVLEQFGRGQSDLQRWESVQDNPADATPWVTEPLWYGIRLRRQGPGRLTLRRAYDLDVAAYRTLVIRAATAGAATVSATALFDGETRLRAEADDRGLVTIPVQGARLLGLELVVEAEPAGRKPAEQEQAVDLEWIVLRPRENITASAHVFANRAVMLAWDRPWWGADRYFVARDRAPLARTDRALAIAAGRSEQTPWLVDTPPVSGDWHYAIAPVEPSGLGLPAPIAVTLSSQPVPTLIYADFPITVDGDLAEWRDALAAPPLVITPASGQVHGEPLAGPADLSASIRLARDSERLYVGALVRDDLRAHRHAWSWMGDGLVLCLGAVRAERGRYLPRYDLVLNYAAGEPPLGRILEDSSGSYPANAKPVAPGSVAVKPTAGGYVLEAMLPLASLSAHGLDLNADEWLAVGLSIYDSDQREGETSRQTALSWNQRKQLYGAAEAALMRVERYP